MATPSVNKKAIVAGIALTGASILGMTGCSEGGGQQDQEKLTALRAAPVEQQFTAISSGTAFAQCKEKFTGRHFNVQPVDATALGALLSPGPETANLECNVYLGQSNYPSLPKRKVAVGADEKLSFAEPK